MTFLEQLRKDKMQAMKEKDKLKNLTITALMSSIALEEKEKKKTLTDEEAMKFVQKELKQATDTLTALPEDHLDLIEETKRRIEIIKSYLPKQLSEEEIKTELEKIIKEENLALDGKSKGLLIKNFMAKFQVKADGKIVNKLVDDLLK